ncbi:MAG: tetraacyldisaccharide 4'-kinase, partial [Candidatus Omnitrophota bacterium]
NITTGGVGKTPLVIWITRILENKGRKVVVLSRGYKSCDGTNDEIEMFKEVLPHVPVMIGRDRRKSIQKAVDQGQVDMFLADDAFQHWPLKRDLDIVAIDAVNPFGNGYMLPRGFLREKPLALNRADVFVLTKTDKVQSTKELRSQLNRINNKALIVESCHVPLHFREVFTGRIHGISALMNQKVVAFCAIGDPSSFEYVIKKLEVSLVKDFIFTDHHHYSKDDIKIVADYARGENINILVTTHKDAVKIKSFEDIFKGLTIFSLDINLEITQGQDELIKRILSLQNN